MAASMSGSVRVNLRRVLSYSFSCVAPNCYQNKLSVIPNVYNSLAQFQTTRFLSDSEDAGLKGLMGFARALEKSKEKIKSAEVEESKQQPRVLEEQAELEESNSVTDEDFPAMLRRSKLMQIGDPSSGAPRIVKGTVFEVVGDDLYIDFGGKFHCVCPRPQVNSDQYEMGARVKVRLTDFEMTSAFLGSEKHVTLQEADCTLVGIYPYRQAQDSENSSHKGRNIERQS